LGRQRQTQEHQSANRDQSKTSQHHG
jgi:hypothetical protein